jgi:hypothetical protein
MTEKHAQRPNGDGPRAVAVAATIGGRGRLPVSLSSFIGRERELAELREALAATRLLTLTGPGG